MLLALLAGSAWLVLRSPWLAVSRVEVTGTHRLDPAVVQAALHAELGRPMALADVDGLGRRVASLRLVAGAGVSRVWPGTLRVDVRERAAVAAVPVPGGVRLEDGDGVDLGTQPQPPAGIPVLRVDVARAGAGALRAAVTVLTGLPPALRAATQDAGAASPDAVWLQLHDGTRVEWGSAEDGERKVAALAAVAVRGRGVVVDVSAPDNPAVRRAP